MSFWENGTCKEHATDRCSLPPHCIGDWFVRRQCVFLPHYFGHLFFLLSTQNAFIFTYTQGVVAVCSFVQVYLNKYEGKRRNISQLHVRKLAVCAEA